MKDLIIVLLICLSCISVWAYVHIENLFHNPKHRKDKA